MFNQVYVVFIQAKREVLYQLGSSGSSDLIRQLNKFRISEITGIAMAYGTCQAILKCPCTP